MGDLLTGRVNISYSRKSFPEIIGVGFYHLRGLHVPRKRYVLFSSSICGTEFLSEIAQSQCQRIKILWYKCFILR